MTIALRRKLTMVWSPDLPAAVICHASDQAALGASVKHYIAKRPLRIYVPQPAWLRHLCLRGAC